MNKKNLLLLVLSLVLLSCNKEISNCYDCQGGLIKEFTLKFDFPDVNFSKSLKNFHKDSITLSFTSINPNDYKKIANCLNTNETLKNTYALVLYLDVDFDNTTQVQLDNIIGFSSYEVMNESLYHKLFVKEANTFKTVDKYSCFVKAVRANDNNKLANLFLSSSKSVSWLMIYSEDVKPIKIKSSHQLSLILNNNLKLPEPCDSPCPTPGTEPCDWTPISSYNCNNGQDDEPCLESATNGNLVDGGVSFEQSYFNYGLHQRFKVDVLSKTTSGQQLIIDYYNLSGYFVTKLNLTLALATYNLLPQINAAVEKILDQKSEVAISASFATQLKNLIDLYIAACDSPTIIAKLNSYKTMIDNYTNITADQIMI